MASIHITGLKKNELYGWLLGFAKYNIHTDKGFYHRSFAKFEMFLENANQRFHMEHKDQKIGNCTFASHKLFVKVVLLELCASNNFSLFRNGDEIEMVAHNTYKAWTAFLRDYSIQRLNAVYKLSEENKTTCDRVYALETLVLTYLSEMRKIGPLRVLLKLVHDESVDREVDFKRAMAMRSIITQNPILLKDVILKWDHGKEPLISLLQEENLLNGLLMATSLPRSIEVLKVILEKTDNDDRVITVIQKCLSDKSVFCITIKRYICAPEGIRSFA